MLNLIDGGLGDSQEKIFWAKNKSSAIILLNTYTWEEGETYVVGYKTKGDNRDIMIGLGIKKGVGPDCYRLIIDGSVVVVAEVLNYTPDISYYAFDQRYLVREEDGTLNFTRRYIDQEDEEVKIEKIKVENKCIITELSTGNMWICDPPKVIDFFSLTTQTSIGNIEDLGGGQIKIDLTGDGRTWKDLCFMNLEEKSYLRDVIFHKNFEVSVSPQKFNSKGAKVDSKDPCIVSKTVYTLTSKYLGELVDLDETPEGWVKKSTGVYTKTILGGVSSSSGTVTCKLTKSGYTGVKTLEEILVEVDKYIFVFYSPERPVRIDGSDLMFLSQTPNLGNITVTPQQDFYVWIALPLGMDTPQITQLGVGYVSEDTKVIPGVIKSGVNLGDYIVFRSLNPGNGKSQEINVWKKQIQ